MVLLALTSVAHADSPDAPYGKYSLDVLDPPYGYIIVGGRRLPDCGDRTKDILKRLKSFEVSYIAGAAGDEVVVDGEPWKFGGFTKPGRQATARRPKPKDGIEVSLSFGVEGDLLKKRGVGFYHVIVWDGSKAACGDARRVGGRYTRP